MIAKRPTKYSVEALNIPLAGDLWNERHSYHLVVVLVTTCGLVHVLEGKFSSFPAGGTPRIFTLAMFAEYLRYANSTITWADCEYRGLDVTGWSVYTEPLNEAFDPVI